MKFQLLAAFALFFALSLSAPVAQSEQYPDSYPVCSAGEGALVADCREALKQIPTDWPRPCTLQISTFFIAATVGTCRITTWDQSAAHCLEGLKILAAAEEIISKCGKDYGARAAGKAAFPGTYGKTGVEIVPVSYAP
ncbi:unnamed protein product [Tuber aestivum]|uniref:Extracellular membrane protein CFEM domain-containing protein n=1 Tax=Tuber aestivum TaxID=59557 RepID=A0A292Q8B4_9PEZI|nr:unnamed protein product [Tuber aestivum]